MSDQRDGKQEEPDPSSRSTKPTKQKQIDDGKRGKRRRSRWLWGKVAETKTNTKSDSNDELKWFVGNRNRSLKDDRSSATLLEHPWSRRCSENTGKKSLDYFLF